MRFSSRSSGHGHTRLQQSAPRSHEGLGMQPRSSLGMQVPMTLTQPLGSSLCATDPAAAADGAGAFYGIAVHPGCGWCVGTRLCGMREAWVCVGGLAAPPAPAMPAKLRGEAARGMLRQCAPQCHLAHPAPNPPFHPASLVLWSPPLGDLHRHAVLCAMLRCAALCCVKGLSPACKRRACGCQRGRRA